MLLQKSIIQLHWFIIMRNTFGIQKLTKYNYVRAHAQSPSLSEIQ